MGSAAGPEALERVRRAFADPTPFAASALYSHLCAVVAETDELLMIAARGQPGQQPTFLFFGAIHYLLLGGADHELARFYPSIVGDRALPAKAAGPVLIDFCRTFQAAVVEQVATRLVQTNHVRRCLGLRLALAALSSEVTSPVHLIEVGASAGLILRFDRYGYRLNDHRFGNPRSPVQLAAQLRPAVPVPDLDVLPALASVLGIDLAPSAGADGRRWLEALIWPEDHEQRRLLSAALAVVAADPPMIRVGDAIDLLPEIGADLPPGQPRVVFHCATRMHVPPARRPAFENAINAVGTTGPLWRVSIEGVPPIDPRPRASRPGTALEITRPDGSTRLLAVVDGHLAWIDLTDPADLPLVRRPHLLN